MLERADFIPWLVVWVLAIGTVVARSFSRGCAGVTLAYCFQLFMLYWVGAAVHALPWSELNGTPEVFLGFRQATFAAAAFAVGALAAQEVHGQGKAFIAGMATDDRSGRACIIAGVMSYFVLAPTLGRISGLNALTAVASQLVTVGLVIKCWAAMQQSVTTSLAPVLLSSLLIPCATITVQGFLGFGASAVATIFLFCAQFLRPRWLLVLMLFFCCYLGLSVFVTYLSGRDRIRNVVWGGEKAETRISEVTAVAAEFSLFDLWNPDHLEAVDSRLNQNGLVGAAVTYLAATDGYAHGETLVDAAIAVVPRIIWPDKPIQAGSGGLVSRFTGMTFADGTSIGIGPVLELYANFGTPAVICGFVVFGFVIAMLDLKAGAYLLTGNIRGFTIVFLSAISFLNVSGSFVEISMGAMASIIVAKVMNVALERIPARKALAGAESASS